MKTVHSLHTIGSIESALAGTTYAVTGLAQALTSAGSEVTMCSLGAPVHTAGLGYRDNRLAADFGWPPAAKQLGVSRAMRAFVAGSSADIFHAHGLWTLPGVYAADAARRRGHPLVLSPHGMLDAAALRYSRLKKAVFWRLHQKRVVLNVNCFHATAEGELEGIRKLGLKQPVAVIPNGIDVPETLPDCDPGKMSVLSLGRLHPVKGLDRLIRAWASVEAEHPGWRLDIIGPDDGGYGAELSALIRKLGLKRAAVSGPVVGPEKTARLGCANLFVLPSLTENFAVTVAESLACGTPVIATRGAPWSGLEAQRCGWWIDHGPEAMATALRQAMALRPHELKMMGQRGRAWMVRDFSWDRVGSDMLSVYRWLMGAAEMPGCVHIE